MIDAYKNGRDLYATIAKGVYKNDYWDNMEHREDGSPNPEGKKRRSNCKSILLGLMYGRGTNSIAEQLKCSYEEAQKIVDDFYSSFPRVKEWVTKTEEDAKKNGYVEDFWGRRRRLPDIQLPKYTIKCKNDSTSFNPLLFTKGLIGNSSTSLVKKYEKQLERVRGWRQYNTVKDAAAQEGVFITDNGGFISQAQRQCVNARVQGGAASMSKRAMVKVFNDPELQKMDFHIVLQIHDELIGECPVEYAEKVADRLSEVMKHSAEPVVSIPFKCDASIVSRWYEDDYGDILREEYKKLKESDTPQRAYEKLIVEHSELTEEQLKDFLNV